MQYMGGKSRISKHIAPIMKSVRQDGQAYVEPFVGGANVIDKMDGWRIGADTHNYLIQFWGAFVLGWEPPLDESHFTEAMYHHVKNNRDEDPVLTGYVGFALSYGAKWFGGWSRNKKGDDYVARAYRSVMKQRPNITGVQFTHSPYSELKLPRNSLVYCDPPYRGTTEYCDAFDNDAFWEWTRQTALKGHTVFVSEYSGPDFAKCVWQKSQYSSLTKDSSAKKAVEKLFVVCPTPEVEVLVMPEDGYIDDQEDKSEENTPEIEAQVTPVNANSGLPALNIKKPMPLKQ